MVRGKLSFLIFWQFFKFNKILIFAIHYSGKILLPATGYLMMVWEVFAKMHGLNDKTTPFLCENVKLMKPIVFGSIDHEVTLMISIQKGKMYNFFNDIF